MIIDMFKVTFYGHTSWESWATNSVPVPFYYCNSCQEEHVEKEKSREEVEKTGELGK